MKLKLVAMAMTTCVLAACGGKGGDAAQEDTAKTLNVYNWSDYIAEDTIPNFEKETGVKVTYDVFDSDEMVETISSTPGASISMSKTSMPANFLKRTALPSITGLEASGPILPRPRTAVPLEITATRLPRAV